MNKQAEYELFTEEIEGELICNGCGCFIISKIYKNKNAAPASYYWDTNPLKCAKCYASWLDDQEGEE